MSRVIVWSTLVGIFYLPAQITAASSTVFSHACAADAVALGSLSSVAIYMYWLIFPAFVLLRPTISRLVGLVALSVKCKWRGKSADQLELNEVYMLRPLDQIEHYYDLLYVVGINRIIMGFTPLAMLSCAVTLFLTKKALQVIPTASAVSVPCLCRLCSLLPVPAPCLHTAFPDTQSAPHTETAYCVRLCSITCGINHQRRCTCPVARRST